MAFRRARLVNDSGDCAFRGAWKWHAISFREKGDQMVGGHTVDLTLFHDGYIEKFADPWKVGFCLDGRKKIEFSQCLTVAGHERYAHTL